MSNLVINNRITEVKKYCFQVKRERPEIIKNFTLEEEGEKFILWDGFIGMIAKSYDDALEHLTGGFDQVELLSISEVKTETLTQPKIYK